MKLTVARFSRDDAGANHRKIGRCAVVRALSMAGVLALVGAFPSPTAGANPPVSGSAQAAPAVRVIHGLRGVVADVYLDDTLLLETFQPERTTDAQSVAEGSHQVDIRVAGSPASSEPTLTGTFSITSGQVMSAVVYLSADGQPALRTFVDDASPLPAGQTLVVVRHAAAAPAIDVRLNDAPVAVGLENSGEAASQVAAGTYQVSVTETGTSEVLAPAQEVPLAEGTANYMYLVGDQGAGTLGWLAVPVAGLQSPPTQVKTGDSGLVAPSAGRESYWGAVVVIGLGSVLLGAAVGWRRLRTT